LGILRSIESRLERVVEGSVGRLFRASVAPVELARKLAKELEEGKVVSVTQTYAPNEYTIYLSPRDRTRFADFEASLRNELASYLAEHARRAGYVMPTRPRVRFETESSLHTGIFGISTALVRDDDAPLDAMTVPPPVPDPSPIAEPVHGTPEPLPDLVAWPPPPEPVVRSPLDPDPSESGPPGGFPPLPIDPDPHPQPPPFVPPLPDVPALPDVLTVPTPSVPAPPVPSMPDLPSLAPIADPPSPVPPIPAPSMPAPVMPPSLPDVPVPAPMAFEPPSDATMITPREPREELVLVHDGQRTPIEGAVIQIGRAPGCDVVLDDRNVSRRHAEIRRRGPVVVLIDLDSTNGTIVNGRRVREHPLADGDRITLGNSRLTFERRTT
jgi:Protein of unknown function (DUF3662)/FHA domain